MKNLPESSSERTIHEPQLLMVRRRRPRCVAIASGWALIRWPVLRRGVSARAARCLERRLASATSRLGRTACPWSTDALESRKRTPQADLSIAGRSLPHVSTFAFCAHRRRRLTASAVSDRASLQSACHALAIGYSLRRHRLATSRVTGSFGCEGAAITAGEKQWRQIA